MSTIYDVSKLAGVSLATVSRVMNGNTPVSEKTQKKVLQAMEQLEYRPNTMAKGLASKRSYSVGLLISELHGPFFGSMMSAVESELRPFDIHTIIVAGHGNSKDEIEAAEFLLSKGCDALIMYVESVDDKYLLELQARGTPIVVLSRHVPTLADHCINLNNEHGGYLATTHLLEQGHRSFAYISGPLKKRDALERYTGHLRALTEFDLTQDSDLVFEGNFQEQGGVIGMTHLLKCDTKKFSALVCANDEMAVGAMATAREAGMLLPQNLSIVGFDDMNYARYVYPRLTTVRFPITEMAEMAARWVLKNIYNKSVSPITYQFEPQLEQRDSVRPVASK